ncbi:MAG: DUF370 domain-containing protein [Clostridia bacterium]|nr:DUF370 domain-containing protein [Clostridia bacterium]MBR2413653.1 DUF370 domain-containing protein [Clostridia bacterium]
MKLINVGFDNAVNADRIVAVVAPDSAPIKRLMQAAKEQGRLLDATQGRKTASVIITDCDYVILSYLTADRIVGMD